MHGEPGNADDDRPAPTAHDPVSDDWHAALDSLTSNRDLARRWRQIRYEFAHRLGTALTDARDDVPAVTGPVLYGVWLRWGLLYIGQTQKAQRRLRDLPVGESHHLATTFPPEIWQRVVVVPWMVLAEARTVPSDLSADDIGLGLEHRLQAMARPLANEERRRHDGGWTDVSWTTSRSRGALAAPHLGRLFDAVTEVWQMGADADAPILRPNLRVVSPQDLIVRRS